VTLFRTIQNYNNWNCISIAQKCHFFAISYDNQLYCVYYLSIAALDSSADPEDLEADIIENLEAGLERCGENPFLQQA